MSHHIIMNCKWRVRYIFWSCTIPLAKVGWICSARRDAADCGISYAGNSLWACKQRPHEQLSGVINAEEDWSAERNPQRARHDAGKQAATQTHMVIRWATQYRHTHTWWYCGPHTHSATVANRLQRRHTWWWGWATQYRHTCTWWYCGPHTLTVLQWH